MLSNQNIGHQRPQVQDSMTSHLSNSSSSPLSSSKADKDIPVLQHILDKSSTEYSKMAILRTDSLPAHLHSLRRLGLEDNSALHLQVSPPASVPLLRHERSELETEAATLRLLKSAGLPVPHVIKHDSDPSLLGAPFLLTTSLSGIPLSQILPTATRPLRRHIDSQIDAFEARVSGLTGPSFGPVNLVSRGEGFRTWADAFEHMLVSVLKDGEDMFVNLPYSQIRRAISLNFCRDALLQIKTAKLVVGGLGAPDGVLIEVKRGQGAIRSESAQITGLVGCKVAWWGDRDLEIGTDVWKRDDVKYEDLEADIEARPGKDGWEVVRKGSDGKEARSLLYAIYHSTVDIVTGFYRPGREQVEINARRTLTNALSTIDKLASASGSTTSGRTCRPGGKRT